MSSALAISAGEKRVLALKQKYATIDQAISIDAIDYSAMKKYDCIEAHIGIDSHAFGRVMRLLKPSALFHFHPTTTTTTTKKEECVSALKLAGFVDVQALETGGFFAFKPAYEVGASLALKRKPKTAQPSNPVSATSKNTAAASAKSWKIDLNDSDDDDGDMIDESTLIKQEDLLKPTQESLKSGCETKKKACKRLGQF